MLLHDDVMFQILLWLPVISLFRFKLVCKSWRALIESSYFIGKHLYLHHYDPSLKDKNRNLIYLLQGEDTSIFFPWTSTAGFEEQNIPISFALTSIESFEEPKVCLELNCPDIHGCFSVERIVSYNGIICLHLLKNEREHGICLWNPTTKQSRVLPQSPSVDNRPGSIGFGFDIKNNDYKVVKIIAGNRSAKMIFVEVYSLNTGSWRRLTRDFSFDSILRIGGIPFNNGTCFFWVYFRAKNLRIACFDFSSEMFHCIPLPSVDYHQRLYHVGVVNDKIACFLKASGDQMELWVFNEYGTANESWTKVYSINPYSMNRRRGIEGVSMNGNHVFFETEEKMCRFNVVTKETRYFTLENMPRSDDNRTLVQFKESLVPI